MLRAIKKLKVLGNGFTVIPLGARYLVQSVPGELSMDQTAVLQQAEAAAGSVSVTSLQQELSWERERCLRTLDKLVAAEIAWVDSQAGDENEYWVPSIFTSLMGA